MRPYERRDEVGEPHFGQIGDDQFWIELPMEDHPEVIIEATFFVGTGGMQLIGLGLTNRSAYPWPPPVITTQVIRDIRIDELYRFAAKNYTVAGQFGVWFDVDLSDFRGRRRPGRRGRADIYYAEVADRYVRLMAQTSTPTKQLAEEMEIMPSSVRDILNEARERDVLTRPKVRGRAGGELTQKGRRLLAEKHGHETREEKGDES